MSTRSIIGLIVLILVIAGVAWLIDRANDNGADATPLLSVSAFNQTKNVSATDQPVNPNDVIIYNLVAENQTDDTISGYVVEVNIADVTSKATLIDASGASYNSETNSLVWTPLDIPARDSIAKQFSVRVNPTADQNPAQMTIMFNNELTLAINPQTVATNPPTTGGVAYTAPTTGPSEWLAVILAITATAGVVAVRKYRLAKV